MSTDLIQLSQLPSMPRSEDIDSVLAFLKGNEKYARTMHGQAVVMRDQAIKAKSMADREIDEAIAELEQAHRDASLADCQLAQANAWLKVFSPEGSDNA